MRLAITPLALALSLAGPAAAWSATDYPYIDDCNVASDGSYRVYMGDDSETCHNFGSGGDGADCRQFTSGGHDWGDCSDEVITSGSVFVTASSECTFFTHTDCKGTRSTSGDHDCVAGAFKSFACNT